MSLSLFASIWASTLCTEYSIAKTTGVRHIELANRVSQRTIDIIVYLDSKYWVLEKPQTGKLKDQDDRAPFQRHRLLYIRNALPEEDEAVEQR